jgi:negative regulator of genetic competence, sporulation and motility
MATDEFHRERLDELIKENRWVTQGEISVKIGILQEGTGYIIHIHWMSEDLCAIDSSNAHSSEEESVT